MVFSKDIGKKAAEKNANFTYDPSKVDAVLLSHAHIDHSGNIPHLIKEGFKGVVYCTRATKDLCDVMLLDSAYIQESDAKYVARKMRNTTVPIEPLYTIKDAEHALEFFTTLPFKKKFQLFKGIEVTFYEAGHVLGSSILVLDITDQEDGKKKRLVFTGDLGRCNLPIINDPHQVERADYLLTESTYGNRTHAPIEEGLPELERVINRTAKRGGKIIIPAFAFERTQELIYAIHILIHQNKIPSNLPVFVDSPLATNITDIFKRHIELYDDDIRAEFKLEHNPFSSRQLKHTHTVDESKKLNFLIGPCIIISSSGMCEAGRIRHHLKNIIEDPKNTIAVVGYMAQNTLGRKLVDGAKAVKIFDRMYDVKAEVIVLESFSAHADMNDLDENIKNMKGLKKVMLVHGEEDQSEPFAERIRGFTDAEVVIMKPEEGVDL